tara:strand:+ start:427848 stop:428639 length:792 start_codon:yes stop_codon:yes gene_type:complete
MKRLFQTLDSEDSSYWFGFTAADGCLVTGGNRVSYTQSAKDEAHLSLLASHFNRPLYRGSTKLGENTHHSVSLQINGRETWDDLYEKGMRPRKSLTAMRGVISSVPTDMTHHFVRGYFDGDGSITSNRLTTVASFVGSHDFLEELKQAILNHVPLNDNKVIPDGTIHKVGWSGKQQLNLFRDWLYRDATVFLARKKNRFDALRSRKYRGVSWIKKRNKWQSMITIDKKPMFLGYFDSEEDAAKAYDEQIINHGLALHRLNFQR